MGCSSDVSQSGVGGLAVPVFSANPDGGGELARLRGVLERAEDCPQVAGFVLVFPAASAPVWEGDVLRYGDSRITIGQVVDIAGGGVENVDSPPENVTAPVGCSGDKYWFVNTGV